MASSPSLLLTELNFLAPQFTPKRRRFNYRFCILPTRIRALKEEGALVEERVVSDVKWSGNGSVVNGSNGSVRGYVNGSGNGSLVKYVNGNGVAAERKEVGRKKRLEEIGKEDAWFKQNGEPQVEVRVYDCAMLFDLMN